MARVVWLVVLAAIASVEARADDGIEVDFTFDAMDYNGEFLHFGVVGPEGLVFAEGTTIGLTVHVSGTKEASWFHIDSAYMPRCGQFGYRNITGRGPLEASFPYYTEELGRKTYAARCSPFGPERPTQPFSGPFRITIFDKQDEPLAEASFWLEVFDVVPQLAFGELDSTFSRGPDATFEIGEAYWVDLAVHAAPDDRIQTFMGGPSHLGVGESEVCIRGDIPPTFLEKNTYEWDAPWQQCLAVDRSIGWYPKRADRGEWAFEIYVDDNEGNEHVLEQRWVVTNPGRGCSHTGTGGVVALWWMGLGAAAVRQRRRRVVGPQL